MQRQDPSWRRTAIRRSCPALPRLLGHRSWGCTLRSVIPAHKRHGVSTETVPRVVLRASIPAGGFILPGDQPRIAMLHPHEPVTPTRCACDGRSRTLTPTSGVDLRTIRAGRFLGSPRRSILPWALSALSGLLDTHVQRRAFKRLASLESSTRAGR
jgi:hypothetical protein